MDTIQIKLSSGNSTTIDAIYYPLVNEFKWCESSGYAVRDTDLKKMHRILIGAKEGELVDHINRDKLDNRLCNLRIVTKEQNVHNQKKRLGTKNKYKGVHFVKRIGLFQARCRMNHQDHFLGYYSNEEAAAHAYNLKAKELSDCIFLNQIDIDESMLNEMLIAHRRQVPTAEIQSGHDNIYWVKRNKKWAVSMNHGKLHKHYGYFRSLEDAIIKRDEAIKIHPKRLLG